MKYYDTNITKNYIDFDNANCVVGYDNDFDIIMIAYNMERNGFYYKYEDGDFYCDEYESEKIVKMLKETDLHIWEGWDSSALDNHVCFVEREEEENKYYELLVIHFEEMDR